MNSEWGLFAFNCSNEVYILGASLVELSTSYFVN
jgi:hypothetical protein